MNIAQANKGVVEAQFDLAILYARGLAVKQDNAEAVHWYQKAANQNLTIAQFNLAIHYTNGEGVQKNISTAKEYLKRPTPINSHQPVKPM